MAEPTAKNPALDEIISSVTGVDRRKTITENKCAMRCKTPDMNFRNERSRREYAISGMCQNCQDAFFGKD